MELSEEIENDLIEKEKLYCSDRGFFLTIKEQLEIRKIALNEYLPKIKQIEKQLKDTNAAYKVARALYKAALKVLSETQKENGALADFMLQQLKDKYFMYPFKDIFPSDYKDELKLIEKHYNKKWNEIIQ